MKKILLAGIFSLLSAPAFTQTITPSTINASGGSGTAAVTILDWSVAEMTAVHTATGGNVIVTNGVLQPEPPSLSVTTVNDIKNKVKVFPNPAGDHLFIETEFKRKGKVNYTVYDVIGKEVLNASYGVGQGIQTEKVNIGKLSSGTYFLHLVYNGANYEGHTSFTIQIKQ